MSGFIRALLLVFSLWVASPGERVRATNSVLYPCSWETSQHQLGVVGGMLSGLLETSSRGTYIDLLRAFEARTPVRFSIDVLSDKRAQRHFKGGHYDAYLLWSNFDEELSPVKLKFAERAIFAFVRQEDTIPAVVRELEGRTVGIPFIYSFPAELFENDKITTLRLAESAESNLLALARGRVDVALVSRNAASKMIHREQLTNLKFDPEKPMFLKGIHMIMQDTDALKCTRDMLAEELRRMKADGSFERITNR